MNNKKYNLIVLSIGILLIPLATWSWNIPTKALNESGLMDLSALSMISAWLTAIIISIISSFRIKKSYKEKLFWAGFILNLLIAVIPLMFFVLIIISGVTV